MRVKLHWIRTDRIRLALMARPRGGDWLDEEIDSLADQGICTLVSLLTDSEAMELGLIEEGRACARRRIELMQFPIEDRSTPSDMGSFQVFLSELMERVRGGKATAIHCRMGIGRVSLVAACLLSLDGAEVTEAFKRISSARGCNVPDTPEQREWVERFVSGLRAG